jgi:hypothetical protein
MVSGLISAGLVESSRLMVSGLISAENEPLITRYYGEYEMFVCLEFSRGNSLFFCCLLPQQSVINRLGFVAVEISGSGSGNPTFFLLRPNPQAPFPSSQES